jgi:acyl-CoA reductase-like NAD-dependent aldehyde dehydrogenase
MRASGKGQRRVADMTHGLDVDHQVVALRRLAKVPLAELSEAMVHRALLMAADMIEKLAAEVAAAAWKEEQERRRGSLSTAPH